MSLILELREKAKEVDWTKGMAYERKENVKEMSEGLTMLISTKPYEFFLTATVVVATGYGSDYHFLPIIYFNRAENYETVEDFSFECNCQESTWGQNAGKPCSHVLALGILANKKRVFEKVKSDALETKERILSTMTEIFSDLLIDKEVEKRMLKLKILPYLGVKKNHSYRHKELYLEVSLEFPTGKSYKLTSKLNKFLRILGKEVYPIGKNYEYNPETDEFFQDDKRLLEIFKGIREVSSLDEHQYYGDSERSSFMGKDGIRIPNIHLEEILEIANRKGQTWMELKKEPINLSFNLEKIEDKYLLNSEIQGTYFFLGDGYVAKEEGEKMCIYPATEHLKMRLEILERAFPKDSPKKNIELKTDKISLMGLMSSLEKIGKVEIGKNLSEQVIVPKNVATEIYIENYKDTGIKLREEIILDGKKLSEYSQDVLVDLDKNRVLKNYIHEWGMSKLSEKEYTIDQEEDIYNFMTENVKELHKDSEVFYEEIFKRRNYSNRKVTVSANLKDHLAFSFSVEGIGEEDIANLLSSIREKKKYHRLKDGSIIDIASDEFKELENILSGMNVKEEELEKGIVERDKRYTHFLKERLSKVESAQIDPELDKFTENLKDPKTIEIPERFNLLREYQRHGVSWLSFLKKSGLGGILADDMGLGKTFQTIAFLNINCSSSDKATIIVAPKSLLYNWKNEFLKFSSETDVKILDGTKAKRKVMLDELKGGEVILTSYGTMQKDIELYENIVFENVILDEAQFVKNLAAKTTLAVKSLKGINRFALTGTPVENNLLELWSIFDFVMPGYLKEHKEFETKFMKNSNMEVLKSFVEPFILRRMKKDVLQELPEKIEIDMPVELLPEQKKLYISYLKKAQEEIEVSGENSMVMLSILTRLRQICSHPGMFIEDYKGDSGKLELLMELLSEYRDSGHRVLLFSQFTKMLKIIEEKIKGKYEYKYIDGGTNAEERVEMTEKFNGGEGDIFLISLKAGGTGLNLTGADVVIHFDPWWNPAVEEQATDRAYRMGQTKAVNVVKFVSVGTIEEKISQLKAEKKQIVEELFSGEGKDILKFNKEDILSLLKS